MTISDWLKTATERLKEAGISSARLDAELILAKVTKKTREQIVAHPEAKLTGIQTTKANQLLTQRSQRIPLVHLTGRRQFYGMELEITPDVLTPRVETEKMVDIAIKQAPKNGSLLDVGTGSGAIALAIGKHRPDLVITATDISPKALKVASKNSLKHEVKLQLLESGLFDQISSRFDVITANLPYLTQDAELMPEVKREPLVALIGGADGLDLYRQFFDKVSSYLLPNGWVLIEADPWQHESLIKLAAQHRLVSKDQDYFILSFQQAS